MKRISEANLLRLRDLVDRKDAEARNYGVAGIELELAKIEINRKFGHRYHERNKRIGAAQFEFDTHARNIMARVTALNDQQRETGEHAMREVGIDPGKKGTDYTIDLKTGQVLELFEGTWIPAKE